MPVVVDDDVVGDPEDPGRPGRGIQGRRSAHDTAEHLADEVLGVRGVSHPEPDVPADRGAHAS